MMSLLVWNHQVRRGTPTGLLQDGSSRKKNTVWSPYHVSQHHSQTACPYTMWPSDTSHSGMATNKLSTRSLLNLCRPQSKLQKSVFMQHYISLSATPAETIFRTSFSRSGKYITFQLPSYTSAYSVFCVSSSFPFNPLKPNGYYIYHLL